MSAMLMNPLVFCGCGNILESASCAICSVAPPTETQSSVCKFQMNTQPLEVYDAFAIKVVDTRALVNTFCDKCWKETPCYSDSKQTRSADEGLTMFYTCSICKHNWLEYS
uniref:TFIIS-type domain-containing protein n=1 Tax=Eutreptiella gymnastica TaxID=73025 RepID=A0A7S4CDW0_9EUGL